MESTSEERPNTRSKNNTQNESLDQILKMDKELNVALETIKKAGDIVLKYHG